MLTVHIEVDGRTIGGNELFIPCTHVWLGENRWAVISPTPERYEWLYVLHSRLAHSEDFLQDLLKLLARYHPRAKSPNPQGRQLKLANHCAIPTPIQQALEQTFYVHHGTIWQSSKLLNDRRYYILLGYPRG